MTGKSGHTYPRKVILGNGTAGEALVIAGSYRRPLFIVRGTGERFLRSARMPKGHSLIRVPEGEPDIEGVDNLVGVARDFGPDLVIGIGGGSVLDTAKAVAGLAVNPGSVLDYLEGIGGGRRLENQPLPLLAVPTTAGTGSEATRNSVVFSKKHRIKKSMRDERLVPSVVILDPLLTITSPPDVTASSGLDALCQSIESYVSRKAAPIASMHAIEGVRLIGSNLENAWRNGKDVEARGAVLLGAFHSGVALANSGLGAAHGIGAALGGLFRVPHGISTAAVLPGVMRANLEADIEGYGRIGEALTGRADGSAIERAHSALDEVSRLVKALGLPRLAGFGIGEGDIPVIAAASGGSSMSGNPRALSTDEITGIIEGAL